MPIVYRYTDLNDNIVKYIGIITSKSKTRTLEDRLKEHRTKHEWAHGNFSIDYIIVDSRTDAEAFESHFITYYQTYNYYNKAKSDWGLSVYLPNKVNWKHYVSYNGDFIMDRSRRISIPTNVTQRIKKKCNIFKTGGYWTVYIPDLNRCEHRRKIRRKKKDDLIKFLSDYYNVKVDEIKC